MTSALIGLLNEAQLVAPFGLDPLGRGQLRSLVLMSKIWAGLRVVKLPSPGGKVPQPKASPTATVALTLSTLPTCAVFDSGPYPSSQVCNSGNCARISPRYSDDSIPSIAWAKARCPSV
jgi:hypothetical protein